MIFPAHVKTALVKALIDNHPYEEVAYDVVSLDNDNQFVGSGLMGELPEEMEIRASSEGLARICQAHPSLAEATKEAALAVDKRTLNF